MNRCDSCRSLSSCPICGKAVDTLDHVGVRGTTSHFTIPVIDYKLAYDHQPSGIWHYTRPCGHRVHPAPPAPVALKYCGGPLWKDGYIWQNVYWGSYWSKPSSANWMNKLHGDFFFVPITNIKRTPYNGQVYNISTKDNSYLVSNAIVHNCDF